MGCATILIADDEEAVRTICRLAIQDKYDVLESEDGEEAWKLILAKRPDLVLTDMIMPKLNGLDLAARIKAHPDLRNTLVVVMTGATAEEQLPGGFWRMGTAADEFLQKPLEIMELRRSLERLFENRVRPAQPPRGGYM